MVKFRDKYEDLAQKFQRIGTNYWKAFLVRRLEISVQVWYNETVSLYILTYEDIIQEGLLCQQ